jgi:hypothetical protein
VAFGGNLVAKYLGGQSTKCAGMGAVPVALGGLLVVLAMGCDSDSGRAPMDIDLEHSVLGDLIGDGSHPSSAPAAFRVLTSINMSTGETLQLWLTASDFVTL